MDLDKLLENLAVISETLKTPGLTNQIDQDPNFGDTVKKLETLVEKIRAQQGDFSVSNENFKKIFNELGYPNISKFYNHFIQLPKMQKYFNSILDTIKSKKFK